MLDQELAEELLARQRALDDERERRLRVVRVVQQACDDSTPLMERQCTICWDPLDDDGPRVRTYR